jgi:hypothetical protein
MHMDILCYSRWTETFQPEAGIKYVEFITPDGSVIVRPTYLHQPAKLAYDHHGYEQIVSKGDPITAVRFTPTQAGIYRYRAMSGSECVAMGTFHCVPSDHHGYVQVSSRDPRYFSCSDGTSYCPIGLCAVGPPRYRLPAGMDHFVTGEDTATLGCAEYRRWFRLLAENGGNFVRIWLSHPYFEAETEIAGDVNLAAFARLDTVVELAREHGIRLKLCFDHFRTFEPRAPFYRDLKHPEDGRRPESMDEWLEDPAWRALWLRKAEAYIARYGGDPVVMAWELWNEMDCVRASRWELVREWTRGMLREIKRMAPQQLVVQSLGSFDAERKAHMQDDLHMGEMDFQQVHRYLDQGAPWEICTLDPVAFSVQAVQCARRPDRPILLAETGAVNDRHTGPFRYYRMDNRGIIFHDTTFPAFFAGAAGTGQIWHWDQYVDEKNLWRYFRPFADLVSGIQLDGEGLTPVDLSSDRVWFLGLLGKHHLIAWVRNADCWHAVLRDETEPGLVENPVFDLRTLGVKGGETVLHWPWEEGDGKSTLTDGQLCLPSFRYGLMLRINRSVD